MVCSNSVIRPVTVQASPGLPAHPAGVRIREADLGGLQLTARAALLSLLCYGHGLSGGVRGEDGVSGAHLMDSTAHHDRVLLAVGLVTRRSGTLRVTNLNNTTDKGADLCILHSPRLPVSDI